MTNNSPLISVIIPVFNVEQYLQKCVDSVLSQTYSNLEIILVNDGSTDGSGLICDKYSAIDDRVRVVHKINGGLSSARNAGLDQCRGEYIAFIDGDDFVSPFFIETLYETAHNCDVDIVSYSWYKQFRDGEDKLVDFNNKGNRHIRRCSAGKALKLMYYQRIPSGIPHRIYKRNLFDTIHYPEGVLFEEMATLYRLYIAAENNAVIVDEQYAYRIRANSIVRKEFAEDKMVVIPISRKIYSDSIEYDSRLKKATASRMLSFLFQVFLQIPENDRIDQTKIWREIMKYRNTVLGDCSIYVRIKNRIAALLTLLGMKNAHRIGRWLKYR